MLVTCLKKSIEAKTFVEYSTLFKKCLALPAPPVLNIANTFDKCVGEKLAESLDEIVAKCAKKRRPIVKTSRRRKPCA